MEDRDATAEGSRAVSEASGATDTQAADGETARPPSAASAETEERELDVEEAERFAASFRPSWEPDAPPAPMVPPAQFVGAAGGAARVIRHSTRGDLSAPKLRKRRGAAYAILGASLLGMSALLYMAIASSSVRPSAELARLSDSTETRIEAMRSPQPAAAPAQPAAASDGTAKPDSPSTDPNAHAAADDRSAGPAAADPNAPPPDPTAEPAAVDPSAPADPTAQPTELAAAADPTAAHPATDLSAPGASASPGTEQAGTNPAAPPTAAAGPNAQANPNPAVAANPSALRAGTNAAAPGDVPDIKTPDTAGGALAASKTPAPLPALPSPQPATASERRAPEKGNQVLLSLAAHPPTTKLKLDGVPIENPFRARLPRSSKHRIEARAPGFAPEVHAVRLENDVQLMISLKREPPANVKADPYRDPRRTAAAQSNPPRDRGAGFVSENPY